MSASIVQEIYLEFLECTFHQILYFRCIYPQHIFQRRLKYGISVWHCQDEEICEYITKFLDQCAPLIINGIADKIASVTYNSMAQPIDVIFIQCRLADDLSIDQDGKVSFSLVEEQLRSAILRLMHLESRLSKFLPDQHNWSLVVMCSTSSAKESESGAESVVLHDALTSGNWIVDNNQHPENILQKCTGSENDTSPKFHPCISLENEVMQLEIGCYNI